MRFTSKNNPPGDENRNSAPSHSHFLRTLRRRCVCSYKRSIKRNDSFGSEALKFKDRDADFKKLKSYRHAHTHIRAAGLVEVTDQMEHSWMNPGNSLQLQISVGHSGALEYIKLTFSTGGRGRGPESYAAVNTERLHSSV